MSAKAWMAVSTAVMWCSMVAAAMAATTNDGTSDAAARVGATAKTVRICVSYTSQVDEHAFSVATLAEEANRIWAPYGVRIDGLTEPCRVDPGDPTIYVRVMRRKTPGLRGPLEHALGSIYFVNGAPWPVINLWADQAVRVIGATPPAMFSGTAGARPRMQLARLLGRSLAHELGHYLLGTSAHSTTGLMRTQYGALDTRATSASVYELHPSQIARLDRTLSEWRERRQNSLTKLTEF